LYPTKNFIKNPIQSNPYGEYYPLERGETTRIEKNKVEVHSSIKHIARKDRIQDKGKCVERPNLVMMVGKKQ